MTALPTPAQDLLAKILMKNLALVVPVLSLDHRAGFNKSAAGWRMTALVAGD
jgi:hypothetical protein